MRHEPGLAFPTRQVGLAGLEGRRPLPFAATVLLNSTICFDLKTFCLDKHFHRNGAETTDPNSTTL